MNKVVGAIFLSVLLGFSCLLAWYSLTEGYIWGGDFSQYIMQAQSVWQGEISNFLQMNRFAIEESTYQVGPIAYPWGFPVLLAPFYAFFGLDMLALKSINIGFHMIFLILIWFGFRRYHSCFWLAILVCLFAFNPFFLYFMNSISSDIPFLVLSTISVLLIGRVIIQRSILFSNTSDQLLLGVIIAISFFLRTQGLLILAALGVAQFIKVLKNTMELQKGGSEAITEANDSLLRRFICESSILWTFILPYVSFLSVTLLWRSILPEGGSSHISLLSESSVRLIINQLKYYFVLPAEFFTGLPAAQIIYGASIPLAIIGMFKRRESDYHIIIYCVMTICLLIVWPRNEGLRFLFPLLPFYVSFALTGLEKCIHVDHGSWSVFGKMVALIPVIVIIVFFFKSSLMNAYKNIVNKRIVYSGPFQPTATEVFSFISSNTEPNSIIVFRKPRIMRLLTNRQSILIDQVDKLMRGDYLCISKNAGTSYQLGNKEVEILRENGRIHLVFQNKGFELYQITNRRSIGYNSTQK